MSDEPIQLDDTALNQSNGSWPGVAVSVLKLDIDLSHTSPHKGDVDLILAHTNDEDLTAKLARPDSGCNAALNASALHGDGGLDASKGLDNCLGRILSRSSFDLVSDSTRAQLLGERQTALRNVGNDDGRGTGSCAAEESDQTDGSSTANQNRVTKCNVGPLHSSKRNTQRLQHRAVLIRHTSDLVAPNGWVVDISAQKTRNWRSRKELDLFTAIVSSRQAGLASIANDVRLNSNPVANLEICDRRMNCDDLSCRLVAENVVALYDHRANAASVPEMNIGARKCESRGPQRSLELSRQHTHRYRCFGSQQ